MKNIFIFLLFFSCFLINAGTYDQSFSLTVPDASTVFVVTLSPGTYHLQMTSPSSGTCAFGTTSTLVSGYYVFDNNSGNYTWSSTPGPTTDLTLTQSTSIYVHNYWTAISLSLGFRIWGETVGNPPNITSATSLSKTAGEGFLYNITASGDTPIFYTISTENPLPPYLTLTGSSIVGTLPVSSQDYIFFFDVIATNAAGNDMKRVTVNVNAAGAPVWASPITINHFVGETVNYDLNDWITEGKPITSFHAITSPVPFGLSVVNGHLTGTISGTPGTAQLEISATNEMGVSNGHITINVGGQAPVYTGPIPPIIVVHKGASFSANLLNNWSGAVTVTMSNLPSWASVSNNVLSGTVPQSEIRERITGITMTATNSYGNTVVTGVEFQIIGAGTDSFYFTSPSTSHAVIGQPFTYQATTNQTGVSFSMGSAPSWLSCNSSGFVTGTIPEGVTGFTFTVTASHPEFGTITLTVQVSCGTSNDDGAGAAQHVIVDNFNDFGSTGFAQGVTSGMGQLAQNTAAIKSGIDSLIAQEKLTRDSLTGLNHLEGIHNDTTSINGQLGTIGSKLDTIANKIPSVAGVESRLDNIANILEGFGLSTDEILQEQKKQTGILEDIRDAMTAPDSVPDMSVDYNAQIYTPSNVSIPIIGSQLNRSFSSVAPIITLPLSSIHASIPDKTFDFSQPDLFNAIQRLRVFEVGCVVIWCLVLIFKTVRTFEF